MYLTEGPIIIHPKSIRSGDKYIRSRDRETTSDKQIHRGFSSFIMALVNVTVISERATLLPWKIISADLGKETLREFNERTLSGTENLELG
ncbi:MAG: hypothetical protein A6F71_09365 [Cycloclasticus sp. symbiont of Poecilosclerida sp. M]|nr:MAG: hypothetical protein A6F71_09365 [Cycloclasticus sp. symbiont of Poecilosclerida sp. M]